MDIESMKQPELEALHEQCRAELLTRKTIDATAGDSWQACKGQEHVKRALIVAAAGQHTVVLIGPPGCGKSLLARGAATLGVVCYERHPCPCGNATDPRKACKCDADEIQQYWRNGAQASLARSADIHIEVPPVPVRELESKRHGTTLANARKQVDRATEPPSWDTVDEAARIILKQAVSELGLDARTVDTVKRVAGSIAALAGADVIRGDSLCEAVQYRRLDRQAL